MTEPDPITSFSPSPDRVPVILRDLGDPNLSLREVAAAYGITAEALAAWMVRPEIRERLESTDSSCTWRTRLLAKSLLPQVLATCDRLLDNYCTTPTPTTATSHASALDPVSADPLRSAILAQRNAETVRKTVVFVYRLNRIEATKYPAAHIGDERTLPHAPRVNPQDRPLSISPAPKLAAAPASNAPQPPSKPRSLISAGTTPTLEELERHVSTPIFEAILNALSQLPPPPEPEADTTPAAPVLSSVSSLLDYRPQRELIAASAHADIPHPPLPSIAPHEHWP